MTCASRWTVFWSVPKGPPTDPRVKRLAIRTEDHPLEYADFEGVIRQGEYGAGVVIHLGPGDVPEPDPARRAGGARLTGLRGRPRLGVAGGSQARRRYALTRIDRGGREVWLLVRMADEMADPGRDPVVTRPDSVVSGRTLEEMATAAQPAPTRSGAR
jgi:DNA ligase D-like protein (predicted 3'-phosphoesterase)